MAEQHLSLSAASMPTLRPAQSKLSTAPAEATDGTAVATKDPRVEPSARSPSLSSDSLSAPSRVGILDLNLSPHDMITSCADYVTLLCDSTYGVSPNFRIEGVGARQPVGAIGSHLEYILTELLKNAFRATVEHNTPKKEQDDDDDVFRFEDLPHAHLMKEDLPEVVITVGVVKGVLTIRIRDRGGGVRKWRQGFRCFHGHTNRLSCMQRPRTSTLSSHTPSLRCLTFQSQTRILIRPRRQSCMAVLAEQATTVAWVVDRMVDRRRPCRRVWARSPDWALGESCRRVRISSVLHIADAHARVRAVYLSQNCTVNISAGH